MLKNLYRSAVRWAVRTPAYKYVLNKVLPKWQWRKKKYTPEAMHWQYLCLIRTLNEYFRDVRYANGVVISTRDSSKVTGLIIPSDLDHSAIIERWSEQLQDFSIIHAVADGVQRGTLKELCTSCEGFVAHVGEDWDYDYRVSMVDRAVQMLGKPYDGSFKFGVEELYCSEIIYLADFDKRCKYDTQDLAGLGQEYISPKGITEAVGMTKIFDNEVNPYL